MDNLEQLISVSALELEEQIFAKEGVRIVIRTGKNAIFKPYNYKNKADARTNITNWYMTRVKPILGVFEGVIIDGNGDIPHGRTQMQNIRESYKFK